MIGSHGKWYYWLLEDGTNDVWHEGTLDQFVGNGGFETTYNSDAYIILHAVGTHSSGVAAGGSGAPNLLPSLCTGDIR